MINPHSASSIDHAAVPETAVPETWIERSAPWISSLLMHAGLGLVAAFILYASLRPTPVEIYEQPISIPDTVDPDKTIPPATAGQEESNLSTSNLKSMQNMFQQTANGADPWGKNDSLKKSLAGLGERANTDIPFIGVGPGGGAGIGNSTVGGDGSGSLAAFGPKVQIGGTIFDKSRAKRTVYLLDHSGSMLDSFDYLRVEVENATNNLLAVQRFSVIMFSEDVTVLGPDKLQRATPDAKRDVHKRLADIRAHGHNDGELVPFQKGFEKAFAMNPEVIFFLTDGEFDPRLVDVVRKLNANRPANQRVEIHTIAYIQIGPDAAESLKKIAAENHGRYKFVAQKDMK
jgi:hypothetical protein